MNLIMAFEGDFGGKFSIKPAKDLLCSLKQTISLLYMYFNYLFIRMES